MKPQPGTKPERPEDRAPGALGSAARGLVARVGAQARRVLLGEAWARALAAMVGALLVLVVIDYVFRLPRAVRVVHLVAWVGLGVVLWRRWVLPAWRFRPSEAEVALRIGRLVDREGAEGAGARDDRLASGVELAPRPGRAPGLTDALSSLAARDADEVAKALAGRRFVRWRPFVAASAALGALALVGAGVGTARPDLARTGLVRALAPVLAAEWPRRTAVADATAVEVHPIGEALAMRALLTRTNQPVGRTQVEAFYRIVGEDGAGPRQHVVLTSQRRSVRAGSAEGELFERLIEPAGSVREGDVLEYHFQTEDDRTETARIQLAERPRVSRITASVEPPAYAAEIDGAFLREPSVRLTPDASGVAVLGPVLEGSTVTLAVELSKPGALAGGPAESRAGDPAGEGAEVGSEAGDGTWTQASPTGLRFRTRASERRRVEIELVDTLGLRGAEPVAVVLGVVADAKAEVTITEPPFDEAVLATASVGVRAEARDDLGVRWLALERLVASPPAGSEGAAPEPSGEPVRMGFVESPGARAVLAATLDLASIGVRAGDEVRLAALGRDVFAEAPQGEADPRVVRSAERRLRVIDEAAFVGQLRAELAGVRRASIEIDSAQGSLAEASGEDAEHASRADRQAALTDRIEAQRNAVQRLGARVRRNALDDRTLAEMLEDASGLLRDAAEASTRAAAELADADAGQGSEDEAREEQDLVRDRLESLIGMLDQGQDNWVARRGVENLLQEQLALAEATRDFGERTVGREVDQLTPEERTELERIADRQRAAAERAREALQTLTERAEALSRFDAGQAEAMSRAARRGRQSGLEQEMRDAAGQMGRNQTGAAGEAQARAAEALEEMLEDIDSAERARDEALRRVLAGVIESLEVLIEAQGDQIEALAGAGEELGRLVDPMVRLATNTLGLLDQIAEQRDLANVAASVGLAADAQERAVGALREGSAESADVAERDALARLYEARDEAARLEEEAAARDNARQRAELRRAYRDLLERQVATAEETEPWVGVALDRRTRAEVRGLGQRQAGIGTDAEALFGETEGLGDTLVFELAHRRIASASHAASDRLLAANADAEVLRRQQTVARLLGALLDALAEEERSEPFGGRQAGGGGGGSGGEPPLVPDLAELKLLRAMQAEAMTWTRNLDEAAVRPGPEEVAELAELQGQLTERAEALVARLSQPADGAGQGGQP